MQLIAWNKGFYDALENMDSGAATRQIGLFFVLIRVSACANLGGTWLRGILLMAWRENLTRHALRQWVDSRAYWYLREGFTPDPVDNPDQRVAEDCRAFVQGIVRETLDLISSAVALFSYVALLWSLSTFPLAFTAFGIDWTIPRYMLWSAFIYVALATWLTHALGKPLKPRLFAQEKHEADFRHALIQLRESAEVVAPACGEAAERRRLDGLFSTLRQNYRTVINAQFRLGLFTQPYMQIVLRMPSFLPAPAYFAGAVTLGGMMQLASAFSNVTTTLSWVVFSYRDLAEFAAVTERLDGLLRATRNPAPMPDTPRAIVHGEGGDALVVAGLTLYTPQGRRLMEEVDITLAPRERTWISAPSGHGKSTLLAAISGLWPYGEGRVTRPAGEMILLPQAGYLSPEGLAVSLTYPRPPEAFDQATL